MFTVDAKYVQSMTDIDMGRKTDDMFLTRVYDNVYHLQIVVQKVVPWNLKLSLKHNVATTVLNFLDVNNNFEKIETYIFSMQWTHWRPTLLN